MSSSKKSKKKELQKLYKLSKRYEDDAKNVEVPDDIPKGEHVIQQILCSTVSKGKEWFLVAWHKHDDTTWEKSKNIPEETIEEYHEKGEVSILEYNALVKYHEDKKKKKK
jgi:hypothetical protein